MSRDRKIAICYEQAPRPCKTNKNDIGILSKFETPTETSSVGRAPLAVAGHSEVPQHDQVAAVAAAASDGARGVLPDAAPPFASVPVAADALHRAVQTLRQRRRRLLGGAPARDVVLHEEGPLPDVHVGALRAQRQHGQLPARAATGVHAATVHAPIA